MLNFTVAPVGISTVASPSGAAVTVGSSLSDTAMLSGAYATGGSIQFALTAPDGTTSNVGGPVSVTFGTTTYAAPSQPTATEVGMYTWTATYTGPGGNGFATDDGTNETLTTTQASPSIDTQASESDGGVVGLSSLTDVATLSGGYNPGGSITFTLTAPDGTTTPEGSVTVTGDGSYNSPSVVATEVGTYTWHAHYGGDVNNSPADDSGANEGVVTTQASPSIDTQASESDGGVVGLSSLTDVATLSGGYNPGGSITFTLTAPDGTTTPEGSVTVTGDGSYNSPSVVATEVGTYTWHAHYVGDVNNSPADDSGANEGVVTTQASPSIDTQASESNGGVVGLSSLTDVATLSGGYNPGGSITFTLTAPDGTTTPEGSVTVTGDGSYNSPSVVATEVGTYTWHAHYGGDVNNSPADDSGANEGVVTTQASPSIDTQASESNGGVVGLSSLTDVATLSGGFNPGGSITFTLTAPDGTTTPEGSVTVTGDGSYNSPSVVATEVGTYTWHAHYVGDVNNSPADDSGANEGVVTTKTCPSIATVASGTANDVVNSSYLSDSATISNSYNIKSGTITFTLTAPDGTKTVEPVSVVPGQTTYTTPTSVLATQTGTYKWSASYSGDGLNNGAVDNGQNESVTITGTNISILTAPNVTVVTVGTSCGPLKDTATLSGGSNPTGSITFKLYSPTGTLLDTETVNVTHGDGNYTTPTGYNLPSNNPKLGAYQWDATYNGNNGTASDMNNTWEQVQVVTPCCNLTGISYNVTTPPPNSTTTNVKSLSGNTAEGDTVTANFTVPAGYYDQLTLVVYSAPESSYNLDDANLQVITSVVTGFFGPGAHSLGPVTIPGSFYQIDFVCGAAIATLGGAGGNNNTYHGQNRFIDSDNGGVNPVGSCELQLTGTVFSDVNNDGIQETGDTGLAGVTVTLTGTDAYNNAVSISTQTNSAGVYTFAGMPFSNAAGYTVTPSVPSGYSAGMETVGKVNGTTDGAGSSSSELVSGISMQTSSQTTGAGYNFGMIKGTSISGEVYKDSNGDGKLETGDSGLSGVTVTLYKGSSTTPIASTTTNSSGLYSFSNLAPGTYKVVETILNNYVGTGSDVGTVGGTANGTSVNVSTIGSVALSSGQTGVNYNFGESQPVCISGKCYNDQQNNCNSGQSGLGGVTVKCYNSAGVCVGSTTTSSSGSNVGCFSFNNLAPGVYTVCSTTLSGYSGTGCNIGSNGGSSPNCSTINGITAGSGASCNNYDFGQKRGR